MKNIEAGINDIATSDTAEYESVGQRAIREGRNLFKVPETNLPGLREKMAKLVKKANKLGLEPVTMSVGDFTDIEEKDEKGRPTGVVTRCFDVVIDGPKPRLRGWEFVATLEPLEGEVLIRSARKEALPVRYRNHSTVTVCEHCKVNRRRSETFVLRHDDGTMKQVGRQCLQDFLGGVDPKSLAAMAELLWAACEEAETSEEGGSGGGGGGDRLSIHGYLAFVAMAVRKEGWMSRGKAREVNEAKFGY